MTAPDRQAYFRSLADEIMSQSTRVRNLIGDRHWLSDGHHKESLVRSVIERHAPSTVLVSRGFVASTADSSQCSREQDVLLVDTRHQGPLFNQGDLLIVLPATVIATISVKSTLSKVELADSIDCINSARAVLAESSANPPAMWCGAFFFRADSAVEKNPQRVYEYYRHGIEASPAPTAVPGCSIACPPGPDFLCCGPDLAYSVRAGGDASRYEILGFSCSGIATALFVATLLDHTAQRLGGDGSDLPYVLNLPGVQALDPPSLRL